MLEIQDENEVRPSIDELKNTLLSQFMEEHEDLSKDMIKQFIEDMLHFAFDVGYDRGHFDALNIDPEYTHTGK